MARFGADIALPDVLIALAACERQGLLPSLRSAVQDLAASKGSQWSPHGARVYLARRPTPKPGSRHIVESAARPLRACQAVRRERSAKRVGRRA